jgi:hypothetical protein
MYKLASDFFLFFFFALLFQRNTEVHGFTLKGNIHRLDKSFVLLKKAEENLLFIYIFSSCSSYNFLFVPAGLIH